MEHLVTMTTHVPDEASEADVAEMRRREAVRSGQLAEEGVLERLWRPPLQPGEWQSIGLFASATADELEEALSSMPLRAWRSDEVVPLGHHSNDPGRDRSAVDPEQSEFLTTFVGGPPAGSSPDLVDATLAGEARQTARLASDGYLLRLWTLPGTGRSLGLWQAPGESQLQALLGSLPMIAWLAVETVPLTRHPSDPAVAASRPAGSRVAGP
ncbi:MAG: muconolactone Delta-isomerase family protein [Nocardioides sp.]